MKECFISFFIGDKRLVNINDVAPTEFVFFFTELDAGEAFVQFNAPRTGFAVFGDLVNGTVFTILDVVNRRDDSGSTASTSFFESADFINRDVTSFNGKAHIGSQFTQALVGD